MGWLDIAPASIRQIFIIHEDTNHVGAFERDSEQLFQNATVDIGEIENRYLTGEVRRKAFHGANKLPMVKIDNQKILLMDGEIVRVGDIKIECKLADWGFNHLSTIHPARIVDLGCGAGRKGISRGSNRLRRR